MPDWFGFKSKKVAEWLRDFAEQSPTISSARTTPLRQPRTRVGGEAITFKTPTGGIPARTGTGETGDPYIWGFATCDLIDEETGLRFSPNQTEVIHNLVGKIIAEDIVGKASLVGDKYFINVADCPES